jgi:pimeloyl-ACP methyl ester carboxylesterase
VRSRYITVASGLRIRVVEAGDDGAPAIVLVPGWGCGAWVFHETLPGLASAGFRAIAVELKGHGLSDKPRPPGDYTLGSMRAHLLEILDSLALERPHLIGHSMGAAIAAALAAAHPDRVESAVFVAPVGFRGVPGMPLFRALTPSFALPALPFIARRSLIRIMLPVVFGSLAPPTTRDIDEFWAPTRFPDFTRALRHLLHQFTWNAPFPELEVPWMTIVGTEDRLSPAGDVARYSGRDGRKKAVIVRGAGHVILLEAPEIVNAAMAEFFRTRAPSYIHGT